MKLQNTADIAHSSEEFSRKFLRNDYLENYMKTRVIPCKFIDNFGSDEFGHRENPETTTTLD